MQKNQIKEKIVSYYKSHREYFEKLDTVFSDRGEMAYKRGSYDILVLAEPAKRILDVGCGSGALLSFLRDTYPNKQYFGVDISPIAIAKAQQKNIGTSNPITFSVADVEEAIPFPEEQFDLIIAHEMIEHVVYPEKVIRNIARALPNGGILFLLAPNRLIRSPLRIQLLKFTDYFKMILDSNYLNPTVIDPPLNAVGGDSDAVYITNPWELHRMIQQAGLEIIKRSYLKCRLIARKP
jgi:SAM-dependent methyltransferase